MPIVFVHGVAQRNERAFEGISVFLETYVAPAVNPKTPQRVKLYGAYWGPLGVDFAWEGLSRPRTAITGQGPLDKGIAAAAGAELDRLVSKVRITPEVPAPQRSSNVAGGVREDEAESLQDIRREKRGELFINALLAASPANGTANDALDPTGVYSLLSSDIAQEIVALDAAAAAVSEDDVDTVLADAERRAQTNAPQGGGLGRRFGDLALRVGEALSRTEDSGLFVASRLLEELRRPLNDLITLFTGDVFVYLANRLAAETNGTMPLRPDSDAIKRRIVQPGSIPREVLRIIERAAAECEDPEEPLVVLSHSMGGQIIYDIVSYFLPMLAAADPSRYGAIRVDFWAAAASQVGLFEEMKMFLVSRKEFSGATVRVPVPDAQRLGVWWNVWDRNDYISYTAAPIFEGVIDEEFVSGRSLLSAHGGYLVRPSFFRRFARHINEARRSNFRRPVSAAP